MLACVAVCVCGCCFGICLYCCAKDCLNHRPPMWPMNDFPSVFNPKARWSVLSVTAHTVTPRCARGGHVREGLGLVEARPKKQQNLASLSIVSGSPSSLLLFLGLLGIKQRGIGAPANPSALSNFADSCCYAVQFSQHFYCCQTCDVWRAAPALRNGMLKIIQKRLIHYRMFKNHKKAVPFSSK